MNKHLGFTFFIAASFLGLMGCSSTPKSENHAIDQILEHEVGEIDNDLAAKIMAEPRPYNAKPKKKSQSRQIVESEIHQKVWWWIRYYTVRDRERFKRILERGENYRPLVQQILNEHQLPVELYYLAMIESGYVTHATSTASAVGIWQFMRPTALNYGLGVSGFWDERRHPIAATHAAAKYLSFLHKKFDSWYLAIAAYNAGQGRIADAVRRGKTRDFWKLAERGYLPKETMDYIPKFLAASTIGEHLQKFGFEEPRTLQEWPEIAPVQLSLVKPVKKRLPDMVLQTSLSEQELVRFNPQLKQALGHSSLRQIRIWVPRDCADRVAARANIKSRVVVRDAKEKRRPI